MGVFQRVFKIFQSEAHSVVDKLEDPIRMTEQGIRDLKTDLQAAMTSLAQVKSVAIRLKKDGENQKKLSADYERKAMLLLQRAQSGALDQGEADRLAAEALSRKQASDERAKTLTTDQTTQQEMADKLQVKVEKLKTMIHRYENELVTLKARARTAESMKKINKQLSKVDSSGTISMLEKMKNKVSEEESLAQAYGEMAEIGGPAEDEIEKALEAPPEVEAADSLAALKAKMGIQ